MDEASVTRAGGGPSLPGAAKRLSDVGLIWMPEPVPPPLVTLSVTERTWGELTTPFELTVTVPV